MKASLTYMIILLHGRNIGGETGGVHVNSNNFHTLNELLFQDTDLFHVVFIVKIKVGRSSGAICRVNLSSVVMNNNQLIYISTHHHTISINIYLCLPANC